MEKWMRRVPHPDATLNSTIAEAHPDAHRCNRRSEPKRELKNSLNSSEGYDSGHFDRKEGMGDPEN